MSSASSPQTFQEVWGPLPLLISPYCFGRDTHTHTHTLSLSFSLHMHAHQESERERERERKGKKTDVRTRRQTNRTERDREGDVGVRSKETTQSKEVLEMHLTLFSPLMLKAAWVQAMRVGL